MQPFHPYQLTETAAEADREFVARQLREMNNLVSPHHLYIRTHPPEPLDLLLRDEAGGLIAGLTASTYWSWLEVDKLWVREDLRHHGFGSQLLQRAEELAVGRGCRAVYLNTFSWQARGFYERHGYHLIGELADFPPGASQYWLRKDLAQD
jgi:GNAT superfamily N-acetyltransferase